MGSPQASLPSSLLQYCLSPTSPLPAQPPQPVFSSRRLEDRLSLQDHTPSIAARSPSLPLQPQRPPTLLNTTLLSSLSPHPTPSSQSLSAGPLPSHLQAGLSHLPGPLGPGTQSPVWLQGPELGPQGPRSSSWQPSSMPPAACATFLSASLPPSSTVEWYLRPDTHTDSQQQSGLGPCLKLPQRLHQDSAGLPADPAGPADLHKLSAAAWLPVPAALTSATQPSPQSTTFAPNEQLAFSTSLQMPSGLAAPLVMASYGQAMSVPAAPDQTLISPSQSLEGPGSSRTVQGIPARLPSTFRPSHLNPRSHLALRRDSGSRVATSTSNGIGTSTADVVRQPALAAAGRSFPAVALTLPTSFSHPTRLAAGVGLGAVSSDTGASGPPSPRGSTCDLGQEMREISDCGVGAYVHGDSQLLLSTTTPSTALHSPERQSPNQHSSKLPPGLAVPAGGGAGNAWLLHSPTQGPSTLGWGGSVSGSPVTPKDTWYMDRLLLGVMHSAHSRSAARHHSNGGALTPNSSRPGRSVGGASPAGGAAAGAETPPAHSGQLGVAGCRARVSPLQGLGQAGRSGRSEVGMARVRAVAARQGTMSVSAAAPLTLPQRMVSLFTLAGRGNPAAVSALEIRQQQAEDAAYAAKLPGQEALQAMLSARSFPSLTSQLHLLLRRGVVKYLRCFWPLRVVDTLLLLTAAFIIGTIHGTSWGLSSVPSNAVMAMTCLGVLSTVTHLRTFSSQRLLLQREVASGVGMPAQFLAANIIDLVWVFTAPALYLAPYYNLTLPRMAWGTYYLVGLLVCWWTSGTAYLVAATLPPSTVLMSGVFVALIMGAFVQGLTPTIAAGRGTFLEVLMGLSYNRWAMEALTLSEYRHYQDNLRNVLIMLAKGIGLCGVDVLLVDDGLDAVSPQEALSFLRLQESFTFESCQPYISDAYMVLFGLGLGMRLVAFLCLRFAPRQQ
ncbi:hypothetical protein V8C86DRAFT_2862363 [Haematococcus lacustris]